MSDKIRPKRKIVKAIAQKCIMHELLDALEYGCDEYLIDACGEFITQEVTNPDYLTDNQYDDFVRMIDSEMYNQLRRIKSFLNIPAEYNKYD